MKSSKCLYEKSNDQVYVILYMTTDKDLFWKLTLWVSAMFSFVLSNDEATNICLSRHISFALPTIIFAK